MEDLRRILNADELHLIKILVEDVQLAVRIGNTIGKSFVTNVGTPQGDCISPILFTLYLANALNPTPRAPPTDHNYAASQKPTTIPRHLADHNYATYRPYGVFFDLQYADDTCWVGGNSRHNISSQKEATPQLLLDRNLHINESKTEEYVIGRESDDSWKKCKYLGSHLDTDADMARRKQLALNAHNKLKDVFQNNKLNKITKMRIFNAFVASIYLYNSELWSMNATREKIIDAAHRRLLRYSLNIRWPTIMTDEEVYRATKEKPWSEVIRIRRMRWLGHLLRLPPEAPVRVALDEMVRKVKRPRGAPRTTWLKTVQVDLAGMNTNLESACEIAYDRVKWRSMVHDR